MKAESAGWGAGLWSAAAVGCLIAALTLWWREQTDSAFVAATLGLVAWFLNLRFRLRRKNIARESRSPATGDEDQADEV